jgi:lysylphosphatidylglycerol synthetase-like protein (DUF2156 family)
MARHSPSKAKAETKPQPSTFRWFMGNVFSLLRRHGNFICGCILIGFCVYETGGAVKAYAGRSSDVQLNFWLSFMANLRAEFVLSITLAGLSIGLYLRERSKHRETRERLTKRITALESQLDPNRTSSHLTTKGLTRKDDR